jgi:hypothetical protein
VRHAVGGSGPDSVARAGLESGQCSALDGGVHGKRNAADSGHHSHPSASRARLTIGPNHGGPLCAVCVGL